MDRISVLVIISIIGFCVIEVSRLPVSHLVVWIFLMALISFWWIPEIRKLSTKYFTLSKKVDDVMVQYKEFEETIYPLLELELANLASVGYMEAGPKSDKIVDFIERLEKLKIVDDNMESLVIAAKSQALRAFGVELESMNLKAKKFISTGLTNYNSDDYVIVDDIYVDFEGLHNLVPDFTDVKAKIKYKRKLQELESFYNKYF